MLDESNEIDLDFEDDRSSISSTSTFQASVFTVEGVFPEAPLNLLHNEVAKLFPTINDTGNQDNVRGQSQWFWLEMTNANEGSSTTKPSLTKNAKVGLEQAIAWAHDMFMGSIPGFANTMRSGLSDAIQKGMEVGAYIRYDAVRNDAVDTLRDSWIRDLEENRTLSLSPEALRSAQHVDRISALVPSEPYPLSPVPSSTQQANRLVSDIKVSPAPPHFHRLASALLIGGEGRAEEDVAVLQSNSEKNGFTTPRPAANRRTQGTGQVGEDSSALVNVNTLCERLRIGRACDSGCDRRMDCVVGGVLFEADKEWKDPANIVDGGVGNRGKGNNSANVLEVKSNEHADRPLSDVNDDEKETDEDGTTGILAPFDFFRCNYAVVAGGQYKPTMVGPALECLPVVPLVTQLATPEPEITEGKNSKDAHDQGKEDAATASALLTNAETQLHRHERAQHTQYFITVVWGMRSIGASIPSATPPSSVTTPSLASLNDSASTGLIPLRHFNPLPSKVQAIVEKATVTCLYNTLSPLPLSHPPPHQSTEAIMPSPVTLLGISETPMRSRPSPSLSTSSTSSPLRCSILVATPIDFSSPPSTSTPSPQPSSPLATRVLLRRYTSSSLIHAHADHLAGATAHCARVLFPLINQVASTCSPLLRATPANPSLSLPSRALLACTNILRVLFGFPALPSSSSSIRPSSPLSLTLKQVNDWLTAGMHVCATASHAASVAEHFLTALSAAHTLKDRKAKHTQSTSNTTTNNNSSSNSSSASKTRSPPLSAVDLLLVSLSAANESDMSALYSVLLSLHTTSIVTAAACTQMINIAEVLLGSSTTKTSSSSSSTLASTRTILSKSSKESLVAITQRVEALRSNGNEGQGEPANTTDMVILDVSAYQRPLSSLMSSPDITSSADNLAGTLVKDDTTLFQDTRVVSAAASLCQMLISLATAEPLANLLETSKVLTGLDAEITKTIGECHILGGTIQRQTIIGGLGGGKGAGEMKNSGSSMQTTTTTLDWNAMLKVRLDSLRLLRSVVVEARDNLKTNFTPEQWTMLLKAVASDEDSKKRKDEGASERKDGQSPHPKMTERHQLKLHPLVDEAAVEASLSALAANAKDVTAVTPLMASLEVDSTLEQLYDLARNVRDNESEAKMKSVGGRNKELTRKMIAHLVDSNEASLSNTTVDGKPRSGNKSTPLLTSITSPTSLITRRHFLKRHPSHSRVPLEPGALVLLSSSLAHIQCPHVAFSLPSSQLHAYYNTINTSTLTASSTATSPPSSYRVYVGTADEGFPSPLFGPSFGSRMFDSDIKTWSCPSTIETTVDPTTTSNSTSSSSSSDSSSSAPTRAMLNELANQTLSPTELTQRFQLWLYHRGIPLLLARVLEIVAGTAPSLRSVLLAWLSSISPPSDHLRCLQAVYAKFNNTASSTTQTNSTSSPSSTVWGGWLSALATTPISSSSQPIYTSPLVAYLLSIQPTPSSQATLLAAIHTLNLTHSALASLLLGLFNVSVPYTYALPPSLGLRRRGCMSRYVAGVALIPSLASLALAAAPNATLTFLPSSVGPVARVRVLRPLGPDEPVCVAPPFFSPLLHLRARIALDSLRSLSGSAGPRAILPVPDITPFLNPLSHHTLAGGELASGVPYLTDTTHPLGISPSAVNSVIKAGMSTPIFSPSAPTQTNFEGEAVYCSPCKHDGLLIPTCTLGPMQDGFAGGIVRDFQYKCGACGRIESAQQVDERVAALARVCDRMGSFLGTAVMAHTAPPSSDLTIDSVNTVRSASGFSTVGGNTSFLANEPASFVTATSNSILTTLHEKIKSQGKAMKAFFEAGDAGVAHTDFFEANRLLGQQATGAAGQLRNYTTSAVHELLGPRHFLQPVARSVRMMHCIYVGGFTVGSMEADVAYQVLGSLAPTPIYPRGPVLPCPHPSVLGSALWTAAAMLWGLRGQDAQTILNPAEDMYKRVTNKDSTAFEVDYALVASIRKALHSDGRTAVDVTTGEMMDISRALGGKIPGL